ncbi:hypothetical protein PMZ80_009585 [Knufia obscura]|uniref:Uncharacterized protein n=2 Tax=Knufia TaxID=430999 RepID=A0AAN8ECU3_9EURO|nr:hypothetical protein PMZ80_009585 [Knufia obscura]KAK5951130.1 hypothetical protein OHC33_007883 [Knufia fluminis]
MAELGLNIYQIIQNELITREGNRSTLGVGFRLAIIETKIHNTENIARNGRIWKLHHSISPIRALTPESRKAARARERKLLNVQGTDKHKDPKDPGKLIREEEVWDVAEWFPRTLLEFKELQFSPAKIRDLMEFYDVPAYRPDQKLIDIHPDDGLREVTMFMETCMEELAMSFGLNWHKIEGLGLPQMIPAGPPPQPTFSPPATFSPPPHPWPT